MSSEFRATHRILSLLEQSKRFSENVYESLPGVMFALDPSLKMLIANSGTAQILKKSLEDILGHGIEDIFRSEAEQKKFTEQVEVLFRGERESVEMEMPITLADGKKLDYHWQLKRFSVGRGNRQFLINVIGHDVSELRLAMKSIIDFERDLDIGRSAQALILPGADTFSADDWSMAGHYEPATKTGGDWWNYEVRDDGSALFLLGDVSGHGVGPAIVTALIAGCYRSIISRHGSRDIPAIFDEFNRQLLNLSNPIYWMTMLAIEIIPQQKEIRWYSAAAPPALFDPGDGTFRELGGASRPLGAGDLQILQGNEKFAENFLLFCSTDGLFEINPKMSTRAIARTLVKLAGEGRRPEELRVKVKEQVEKWRQGLTALDDIAFFILGPA